MESEEGLDIVESASVVGGNPKNEPTKSRIKRPWIRFNVMARNPNPYYGFGNRTLLLGVAMKNGGLDGTTVWENMGTNEKSGRVYPTGLCCLSTC